MLQFDDKCGEQYQGIQRSQESDNGASIQISKQYQTIKSTDIQIESQQLTQSSTQPRVPQTRRQEMLICTKCRQMVKSDVNYLMGRGSYILVVLLLAGILTAIFAFLPCVVKQCQDAQHRCPKCLRVLGTISFLC